MQSPFWGIDLLPRKGDNGGVEGLRLSAPRTYLPRFLGRSVGLGIFLLLILAPASYAWTNPCSGDIDMASCERLTYISAQLTDVQQKSDLAWQGVWICAGFILVLMIAPIFIQAFKFWKG